jgi:anaphase-promoting complex subunit 2
MDELIASVGAVDRTAALKALLTWVDKGVLKEDSENVFRLLEVAEAPTNRGSPRPGAPSLFDNVLVHELTHP